MKTSRILALVVLAAVTLGAWGAKPQVIAHRGYWKTDGSSQNSLRSIVKADSIGCFGSEFDVWMTADSVLVVNHDPTINGITIETAQSADVLAQKLSNGENVPTLASYLTVAKELPGDMRLICELKPHVNKSQELKAVKAILAMMKDYGLEDRVDYITFSKDGFRNLIKLAPEGTEVYYLEGDYIPAQVKFAGGAGLDYNFYTMRNHPEWIKEAHDLGLKVNVWTVNSPEFMQWCIDHEVDFITTNEPELLQSLLK